MVAVVQLVEHLVVVQDVAGSSPVSHPNKPLGPVGSEGVTIGYGFRLADILRSCGPPVQCIRVESGDP